MSAGFDQRDNPSWVVIELTRAGEVKVEEGGLDGALREALRVDKHHPIFIPSRTYSSQGQNVTLHLMEGYVFVASGLPEVMYFNLEGTCPYVRRVLGSRSPNGVRVLNVIPDSSVQDMRRKLSQQVASDLVEGMRVVVTEGAYTHLDGDVLELDEDSAHVRFTMRSLDLITRIPRIFLAPISER